MTFLKLTQTYSRIVAALSISMLLVACGGGSGGTTTASPTTYSISGTVYNGFIGGSALSGATLTLAGASSGSVPSDKNGAYSFTNLPLGTYTLTPTKAGVTFTPTTLNYTISNVGGNITFADFAGN